MPSRLENAIAIAIQSCVDEQTEPLKAKNAAQQQEIERLRGAIAELCQTGDEQIQTILDLRRELAAAQRKGERAADVDWLAAEIAAACSRRLASASDANWGFLQIVTPILRRHLDPQGEPHERDEVPVQETSSDSRGNRKDAVPVEPTLHGVPEGTAAVSDEDCVPAELAALRKQAESLRSLAIKQHDALSAADAVRVQVETLPCPAGVGDGEIWPHYLTNGCVRRLKNLASAVEVPAGFYSAMATAPEPKEPA
jgi:hypothetical protein